MAGTKEIKRRIRSVKNTEKITKAMELVAASKMKRAIASTLASRLYARYSWEILTSIANSTEEITHPLFVQREIKNILLVLITSNRGLCGAYNAQVIKKALSLIKQENNGAKIQIITIGKKGDVALRRVGQNIIASFFELPDNISISDVTPILQLAINEYSLGNYDKILIAYTDFISALTQKPNIKQILPISKTELKDLIEKLGENTEPENRIIHMTEKIRISLLGYGEATLDINNGTSSGLKVVSSRQHDEQFTIRLRINGVNGNQIIIVNGSGEFEDVTNTDSLSPDDVISIGITIGQKKSEIIIGALRKDKNTEKKTDYLFEGDQDALISSLAEKLTRMQIYQMLLESNASEQSSRMVAMKNASEASGEMIDDLTLVFNKARQANVTKEISEISVGMASVS